MIKLKAEMLKVLKMPLSNDIKFSGTSVKQDGSRQVTMSKVTRAMDMSFFESQASVTAVLRRRTRRPRIMHSIHLIFNMYCSI